MKSLHQRIDGDILVALLVAIQGWMSSDPVVRIIATVAALAILRGKL